MRVSVLRLPIVHGRGDHGFVPSGREPDYVQWLAPFITLDVPSSSALTRGLMGWEPDGPALLADVDTGDYFVG